MGLRRRFARARLAARVIRRLRRAGVTDARYDAKAFAVRFTPPAADGAGETPVTTVIPLDAVTKATIDRFVSGFLSTPEVPGAWSQAAPLLRPVLRGAVPVTGINAPLRRPALPFLAEFVVVDHPDTMTYVSADQLAGWAVTADEVFATARANLPGAVLRGVATEPTVVQFVDDGDSYWTSHLLLDGWLAGLAEQVGGVPVAFAPERGTLIVAANGDRHLPDLFARAEVAYLRSPRAITPMAYVSDEHGRTVPYPASPGDPLYDCVRRAATVQAMQEYARQAETLAGAAPLEVVDGVRTRTTADRGDLLPRADEVLIGEDVHTWADIADRLTAVPGADPPRFRLTAPA